MEEQKSVNFVNNKYTRWYFSIINRAKKRNLPISKRQVKKIYKSFGYTEVHHIIPKSLGGGNSENNLIRFLAKEHYICHLLLTKMVTDSSLKQKMITAYIMMTGENSKSARIPQRRLTSRLYAKIREEYSQYQSVKQKGKIVSEGTRKKLSEKRKGVPLSEETKKKLSNILKGRKPVHEVTAETREKMSRAQKGKKMPESFKRKISEINTGEGNPFYGKRHSAESLEKMLSYHNNEEVRKQKSLRVKGDNNPAKRADVRKKISETQKAKMDFERKNGIGYFSQEAKAKRRENQAGSKNGNAKIAEFTDPNGKVYIVVGGTEKFCIENNLSLWSIFEVLKGKKDNYNGWKARYLPKTI